MSLSRVLAVAFLASGASFAATYCTTPDPACLEPVPVEKDQAFYVYRSRPLTQPDKTVERIFILVHGVGRNGNDYYLFAIGATEDAGQLDRTLVIAPRFHSNVGTGSGNCKDALDSSEINFFCRGWTDGTTAADTKVSSYTAMDRLLEAVANKTRFPALQEIVLAGHSAGGQFVQRYLAINRAHPKLAVPIRYVVANPSTYMYLDAWRPNPAAVKACPGYNQYKFGLIDIQGYASETGPDVIRGNYAARNVTYLLGQEDNVDAHSMDKSCQAMAQGPFRLQRGQAFFEHLNKTTTATHKLVEVPKCDHSAECMYRSVEGRQVIFNP
ncbi:MAG: hypothetical protein SGI92_27430 [Bryobacteraceae bacterium]|nr:hypothetical protein [Bryobacteraceae bacterium]